MSGGNVGAPDWQRGTINAGILLGQINGGVATINIGITANVKTLLIANTGFDNVPIPTVRGITTGHYYPGSNLVPLVPGNLDNTWAFRVASVLDPIVAVSFGIAPTHKWYVLGDNGDVTVNSPDLSLAVQSFGNPPNPVGFMEMGYDGANAQPVAVDTTGKLIISNPGGGATPQPVGGALVSEGILAMGSDGTDGRAISTDSNGRQIPLVPTLQSIKYGAAGNFTLIAAPPAGSAWYLFAIDWLTTAGNATNVNLNDGVGNTISLFGTCGFASSGTVPLHGYRVTTSVIVAMQNNAVSVVLRYASGP